MDVNHNGAVPCPGELRIMGRRDHPGHLRLAGELDLGTYALLKAVARTPDYRMRDLQLDTSALAFVDCVGLATLVELARAARAEGLRFTITSTGEALDRLSALTGTSHLLGSVPPTG